MRHLQPKTGEYFASFSKTLIQLYWVFVFSIFDLIYQRGYQRQYYWTLNSKVFAYEAAID